MLKKLVVVRHGFYGDSNLTQAGRQQIEDLGAILAGQLNGSKIVLLSSPATRAKETAEILARHLGGITPTTHEILDTCGADLEEEQAEEALQLVEKHAHESEVVVLSTHLEFIDEFPHFWGKKHGFRLRVRRDTPKGTARVIDVATGQEEHVYPQNLTI